MRVNANLSRTGYKSARRVLFHSRSSLSRARNNSATKDQPSNNRRMMTRPIERPLSPPSCALRRKKGEYERTGKKVERVGDREGAEERKRESEKEREEEKQGENSISRPRFVPLDRSFKRFRRRRKRGESAAHQELARSVDRSFDRYIQRRAVWATWVGWVLSKLE